MQPNELPHVNSLVLRKQKTEQKTTQHASNVLFTHYDRMESLSFDSLRLQTFEVLHIHMRNQSVQL